MIVVDTSALLAVLQDEPDARCLKVLTVHPHLLISAGTLTEALIVASRRNLQADLADLIDKLAIEVVSVTEQTARACATTHLQWGKGIHPAGLNFGDCFAYALAKERNCPLLYVGNDFSQTDIVAAG